MPVLPEIAQRVADELNGQPFGQAFTAQRHYRPQFSLEELATLRVSVVPRSLTLATASRAKSTWEVAVDVAIQRRLQDPGNIPEIDTLVALVEEVIAFLDGRRLAAYSQATFVGVENDPAYALDHMDELSVFTSVVTVRYRVMQ
jgi:hypothetical protein